MCSIAVVSIVTNFWAVFPLVILFLPCPHWGFVRDGLGDLGEPSFSYAIDLIC